MQRTITVLQQVQVTVDLSHFGTQVLMQEVHERNNKESSQKLREMEAKHARKLEDLDHSHDNYVHIPPLNSQDSHPLHDVYYTLKLGKEAHALDLMRAHLGDLFGVVL